MGRPATGKPRLAMVLYMKGRLPYKDWIEERAQVLGVSVSEFVDMTVRQWAKHKKIDPPPKRLED